MGVIIALPQSSGSVSVSHILLQSFCKISMPASPDAFSSSPVTQSKPVIFPSAVFFMAFATSLIIGGSSSMLGICGIVAVACLLLELGLL